MGRDEHPGGKAKALKGHRGFQMGALAAAPGISIGRASPVLERCLDADLARKSSHTWRPPVRRDAFGEPASEALMEVDRA